MAEAIVILVSVVFAVGFIVLLIVLIVWLDSMGTWTWYKDKKRTRYMAVYGDLKEMQEEANEAMRHGWDIESIVTQKGHVNIGRTAGKTAIATVATLSSAGFLAPLFFLVGSRTKGRVTVVYYRPGSELGD